MIRAAATLLAPGRLRRPGAREALERYRDARVRRLVAHAYERVPYYRRLLDAHGIRPRHVRAAADLALIPPSTRSELAATDPAELVARGATRERLIPMRSSGSSGVPFTVLRTWREQNLLHLFRLRSRVLCGWRPGWRIAHIRYRHAHSRTDNKAIGRVLDRAGISPTTVLDLMAPPAELAARLRELRPDMIISYPATLALVAAELGPAGRELGTKLVICGAETLTAELRGQIGAAFAAPVRDSYGTSEFNLVAWECADTGALHTCDDGIVLEVERTDGGPAAPGESGEAIGTALHSFAMPFIRYRTGDLVRAGEPRCRCGLPFGTLTEVQGRTIDYIPLPDGRIIHPYAIMSDLLRPVKPWLRQHQIVQERLDRIVLRLVPLAPPPASELAALERAVADYLGVGVHVDIVLTDELPREPSGKVRATVSLLRPPLAGAGA